MGGLFYQIAKDQSFTAARIKRRPRTNDMVTEGRSSNQRLGIALSLVTGYRPDCAQPENP